MHSLLDKYPHSYSISIHLSLPQSDFIILSLFTSTIVTVTQTNWKCWSALVSSSLPSLPSSSPLFILPSFPPSLPHPYSSSLPSDISVWDAGREPLCPLHLRRHDCVREAVRERPRVCHRGILHRERQWTQDSKRCEWLWVWVWL